MTKNTGRSKASSGPTNTKDGADEATTSRTHAGVFVIGCAACVRTEASAGSRRAARPDVSAVHPQAPADARSARADGGAEKAARVDGEAPRRQAPAGDRHAARVPRFEADRRVQGRGHIQARRATVGKVAPLVPD